jgi:hypothetical protein
MDIPQWVYEYPVEHILYKLFVIRKLLRLLKKMNKKTDVYNDHIRKLKELYSLDIIASWQYELKNADSAQVVFPHIVQQLQDDIVCPEMEYLNNSILRFNTDFFASYPELQYRITAYEVIDDDLSHTQIDKLYRRGQHGVDYFENQNNTEELIVSVEVMGNLGSYIWKHVYEYYHMFESTHVSLEDSNTLVIDMQSEGMFVNNKKLATALSSLKQDIVSTLGIVGDRLISIRISTL